MNKDTDFSNKNQGGSAVTLKASFSSQRREVTRERFKLRDDVLLKCSICYATRKKLKKK